MKFKFLAAFFAALLLSNLAGSTLAGVSDARKNKLQTNQLVAMLPASDGVVTMNGRRFFDDALPKLLSANQKMLGDMLAQIAEMEQKTGIDLRRFEYIAAGFNTTQVAPGKYDFQPVVIARGDISGDSIIAAAKAASGGKYREERFEGKVLYIFQTKDLAAANKPAAAGTVGKVTGQFPEVALSVVGPSTVVFGMPDRVRTSIEGKTRIGTDLVDLLNRKEITVVNMAAKMPSGVGAFLPLDDDNLGKSLDSIRYIFGNMDVVGEETQMNLTARTVQPVDAQNLFDTLDGLKSLGGMLLGGSKRPDQQLYARLLQNAKLSKAGSDVALDIKLPQSDVDALIAIIAK
jgi:hypothetical protein